ncbi:MAG TPA: hypothetical protein VF546_06050 [Pyrinomonadaceae bacterium]|jgi:hypothetical protein
MPDYIPGSDAEFDQWLENFTTGVGKEKTALKVADADVSALSAARSEWAAKYAQWAAKRAETDAARQAKDDARRAAEEAARACARQIQADKSVPDATRAALRLTVPDQTRTASAAPATRPGAVIDTSQSLRHTIRFFDEATPNARRKPDGVRGCEIWVKVGGPAPADPAELRFLALDSATPYVAEYEGADAGQTAHYRLRWHSTRGEAGPWSQVFSATVTA